jgi:hypothetical protein
MKEQIKRDNGLVVLKLYLDRTMSEQFPTGSTVFSLEIGGEPVLEQRVDTDQLGVPRTLQQARRYRYGEPEFSIPESVLTAIRAELVPNEILWFELASPSGNLAMVPWERLLLAHLDVPIVRLPYLLVPPSMPASNPQVVLCASSPRAKAALELDELLEITTYAILDAVMGEVLVHIFTDQPIYHSLQRRLEEVVVPAGEASGVRLYDPDQAGSDQIDRRALDPNEPQGYVENPWLRWISGALAGRGVDVVHFVCHSYLGQNQGMLAFAESPARNEDRAWSRFIGAQQLSTFLNLVGAWSVVFTSPPTDYSVLGARMLLDGLARVRPSNLLLHDLHDNLSSDAISNPILGAYQFLLDRYEIDPPESPTLSLYCHPQRVSLQAKGALAYSLSPESTDEPTLESLNKSAGYEIASSVENMPSWIASSVRYFEQSTAKALKQAPLLDKPEAARDDVLEALSYLADVVERHTFPQSSTSDDDAGGDVSGQEEGDHA